MGKGLGVEVKGVEARVDWGGGECVGVGSIIRSITMCLWTYLRVGGNATPEVGCVVLKDWRSSWSTSSRLPFYFVTHELHALPNTTLNCTCVGRPHLPHLLAFWSTNFNITYGH
jgi:hypothetical protein